MTCSSGEEIPVPSPGDGRDIGPALSETISRAAVGSEIVLPAGRFRLDGGLRVRQPLTLRGQGATRTTLFQTERSTAVPFLLSFDGQPDGTARVAVADIGFEGAPAAAVDENHEYHDAGLQLVRCAGFAVRRCRFASFGQAAVRVRHAVDHADGLVVGCAFADNHFPNPRPDPVAGRERPASLGYGVEVRADVRPGMTAAEAWRAAPAPGSAGFIFIEDNLFAGHRHAVAGGEGGLYVFRHNVVVRHVTAHAVDAHGAGAHGNLVSTRFYEVYGNRLVAATAAEAAAGGFDPPHFGTAFRGGEGVVFDNDIVGFRDAAVRLAVEAPGVAGPVANGWVRLHVWGNRVGPPGRLVRVDPDDVARLVEGRDYFLAERPGYREYTYPHPRTAGPG